MASGTAREDIFGCRQHINKASARQTGDQDFVMKACLVLCDFDVTYNVANFTGEAIAAIEARWGQIKTAIENTFRLVNRYGLGEENLASLNALLPIAYYLYHNPGFTFRGTSEFRAGQRRGDAPLLLNSLFVGPSSASPTARSPSAARRSAITCVSRGISPWASSLTHSVVAAACRSSMPAASRNCWRSIRSSQNLRRAVAALSRHRLDGRALASRPYHPASRCREECPAWRNLPEHRIVEIIDTVDRVGNLQLLRSDENIEKSALPFRSWITGRDRDFLARNLIPDAPDLWDVTQLPEFVRAREQLIRERLMQLAGLA